jgi:hypothetical protein
MRKEQLHLWISELDYQLLKALAQQEDEPVTRIVRRLIRQYLNSLNEQGQLNMARSPIVSAKPGMNHPRQR